jgi:hypothetical protein
VFVTIARSYPLRITRIQRLKHSVDFRIFSGVVDKLKAQALARARCQATEPWPQIF